MLPSANLLGALLALASAAVWGSGDFTGGYATRRSHQFHVLAVSALSGLVVLIGAALLWHEALPSRTGSVMAMLGGIAGALGIAALYRALSLGHAAGVAPVAAAIGAALPVMFGALTEGLPGPLQLLGFGLAIAGIWLVSATPAGEGRASRHGFTLACLAGVGFGGFFIFLGRVDPGKIFTPLIIARAVALCTGLGLVRLNRLPPPSLKGNPFALLAGLLDAGGNLLYVLARQFTRLDVAAVLSSLYPASTVLLAGLIFKERVTPGQKSGIVLCLAALALIGAHA